MKQHITKEQMVKIDSLTMKPYFDTYEMANKFNDACTYGERHPDYDLLMKSLATHITIGKMIEILKSKSHSILIETDSKIRGEWYETYQWWNVIEYNTGKLFQAKELTDALWEVTRYVLSSESND